MAEQATRRQRSDDLTTQERNEGRITQSRRPGHMERYRTQSGLPSVFSLTPGEFFTMNPISLMRRLTEDIDRAFFGAGTLGGHEEELSWAPSVEVRQSGNNLVVRADLPGVNENDIRLEATPEGLILEGEKKREEEREEGGLYRSERVYGHFYRHIALPDGAKLDQVQANFRNGVLEVTVPVPELQQNRRQIPISTSGQSHSQGVSGSQSGSSQASRAAVSGSSR
jgi:HSP20 family protein